MATNLPMDRGSIVKRIKKFWNLYSQSQSLYKAYIGAGYKAKNRKQAESNACILLKRIDKHLNFKQIMDSQGLTDRYISDKLKTVIEDADKNITIKGLNLATRCKGHQAPSVNLGIGVKIVIGSQTREDDKTIDVTVSQPDKAKAIQVTE